MMGWQDCPEAAGPDERERRWRARRPGAGAAQLRLPQLDQQALAQGLYVPARGFDPYRMSPEMVERERAEADAAKFERRQVAERAAFAAGMSALEAGATASRLLAEAAEIADKAVSS